jgi:hypothetical protein
MVMAVTMPVIVLVGGLLDDRGLGGAELQPCGPLIGCDSHSTRTTLT